MFDQFGRNITYLRLSVTQKCNLNCVYCNPTNCPEAEENHLLTTDDIGRICRILYDFGIRRIRLTGGEPLMRHDLEEIVSVIRNIGSDIDISLSTNGQSLATRAAGLKAAGLNRVNISIDSTDSDKFRKLTGGGKLELTLQAIDACLENKIVPIKLNTVLMRTINDDEISSLIALTRDRPLEVRFIELMPMSDVGRNEKLQISADEVLKIESALVRLEHQELSQPAVRYQIPGYAGTVGLIRPISHKFCADCNRIRITADGMLKPCLGTVDEVSLLPALKDDDQALKQVLKQALINKPRGHNFNNNFKPDREMNRTGG